MPLLLTISNPTMNLITRGEMTEDIKNKLSNDTWLNLISVSGEIITIRISCITAVQEITDEKRIELENKNNSIIQKAGFAFKGKPPN